MRKSQYEIWVPGYHRRGECLEGSAVFEEGTEEQIVKSIAGRMLLVGQSAAVHIRRRGRPVARWKVTKSLTVERV